MERDAAALTNVVFETAEVGLRGGAVGILLEQAIRRLVVFY